jgi:glycosyltransferase involved in cell wall biosynthesis
MIEKKEIKIVHISTSYKGGAGTAALRIHEALLANKVNSTFLSLDIPIKSQSCVQLELPAKSFLQKVVSRLIGIGQHRLKLRLSEKLHYQNRLRKMYPYLKCEWTSLPFSGYNILNHDAVKNADIIHLHWVSGVLDYPSFFKDNSKPLVWTLHDMNPLQGIFHYKEDEYRNEKIACKVNGEIFEIKKTAIKNRKSSLTIVSPSQWLTNAATNSSMFAGVPNVCIPYTLNTEVFFSVKTDKLRERMNIPEASTLFLFVAQTVENYRKGFDLLIEALSQMQDNNIILLVIGHSDHLNMPGLKVINLGIIADNEKLQDYYSLADAFIIPSREDNLPNVMLESMACGTPVISFDLGGMAEFIINDFNGLKATEVTVSSLKNLIERFIICKSKFESNLIRQFALGNFSNDLIAKKYMEIYSSTI